MNRFSIYPSCMKLQGGYSALVVGVPLPSDQVRRMLPPQLLLAPNPMTGPTEHPVFFLFGHQYDVRMTSVFRYLFKMDYLEHITFIPYVKKRDPRPGPCASQLFDYTPQLFLDDLLPTVGGRLVWGLRKSLGSLKQREGNYQVSSYATGAPLISLDYRTDGPSKRPTDYPNFAPMAGMFDLASVENICLGDFGPIICSSFDWNIPSAIAQPIEGTMTLQQGYLPGLQAKTYPFKSLADAPWGAFRLTTRWTYSMPYVC